MKNEIKRFLKLFRQRQDSRTDNKLATLGNILSTTPSTVNGAMWYEVSENAPVIKICHNGHPYSVNTTMDILSPNLTISPSSVTIEGGTATADVSYLGSGTISLNCMEHNINPSYNASTKQISVPYSTMRDSDTIVVEVNLSASTGYTADSKSFTVTMLTAGDEEIEIIPIIFTYNEEEYQDEQNEIALTVNNSGFEITMDAEFQWDDVSIETEPDFDFNFSIEGNVLYSEESDAWLELEGEPLVVTLTFFDAGSSIVNRARITFTPDF